jgi:two-component system NtrC family sensor kinase
MKNKLLLIFFTFIGGFTCAQQKVTDSLLKIINLQKFDTAEVIALAYMGNLQTQKDSAIIYAQQGIALAEKLNYSRGYGYCLLTLSGNSGDDFGKSIQFALKALDIFEDINDYTGMASAHLVLQGAFWSAGDYKNSLVHSFAGEKIAEENNVIGVTIFPQHRLAPLFLAEIGQVYLLRNQLDSAEFYTKKSIAQNELFNGTQWNFPVYLLAYVQTMNGDYEAALKNFYGALSLAKSNGIFRDTLQVFSGMSTLFKKIRKPDSAIYYAQIVVHSVNPELEKKNLLEALSNLAEAYKLKGEKDSAIKYIEFNHALKDSIFSTDKDRAVQAITFNLQLKEQETIAAQQKYKSRVLLYAMSFGLLAVLLIAGLLWRNNLHRKKAYSLLEQQKRETDNQKQKVETTLEELKVTQSQLIQSEKMASLGVLTAGIAHEIQNPLNFVNNFSDVNKELLTEMKDEMNKGNLSVANDLANDLIANEEKINHHGKRADAIVKGMLQHSQHSTGQKESTDINKLADEYLRLAYHGLRAKDKAFNATMKTDFDEGIGNINIIPQDIGRVMLNLINNAFYACAERSRSNEEQPGLKNYEPTVSISTKKTNGKIEIIVNDNGNGIPQKIIDKIFQPFFTTKPTGQGTGLGLSVSYDIIKAHGGEIKVESDEGEGFPDSRRAGKAGTTFSFQLPII